MPDTLDDKKKPNQKTGLYTNEAEPLPDTLLKAMIAAKNVNSGLMTLRQVMTNQKT